MNERSFLIFNKDEHTFFVNLNQIVQVIVIEQDNEITCTGRLSNSDTFTLDGKVARALLARLTELQVEPSGNQMSLPEVAGHRLGPMLVNDKPPSA